MDRRPSPSEDLPRGRQIARRTSRSELVSAGTHAPTGPRSFPCTQRSRGVVNLFPNQDTAPADPAKLPRNEQPITPPESTQLSRSPSRRRRAWPHTQESLATRRLLAWLKKNENTQRLQLPVSRPLTPPPEQPPAAQEFIDLSEDICRRFNHLPELQASVFGEVPNHWNISIRRIPFVQYPAHVIFIVQPDSGTIDCRGPIEEFGDLLIGNSISARNHGTMVRVALGILANFVQKSKFRMGRPCSWCTNNTAFASKMIHAFDKLDVRTPWKMPLGSEIENARADQLWRQYCGRLELIPIDGGLALRVSVFKRFDRSELIQNIKAELILPVYPDWCYPAGLLRITD